MAVPFAIDVIGVRLEAQLGDVTRRTQWSHPSLIDLLSDANGFYAFDRGLLVRPFFASTIATVDTIETWNHADVWRGNFKCDTTDMIFFAEDLFGEQFALRGDHVYRFNPESAESAYFARDVQEFLRRIEANPNVEVGSKLAHEWNHRYGLVKPGKRLLPKVPFVLGGAYEIDNLYPLGDREGMLFRAEIANRIRDVPDGGTARLVVERRSDSTLHPEA